MAVDGVGNTTNTVNNLQGASGRSEHSEIRASLISSSATFPAISNNWYQAIINNRLNDGTFILRTNQGNVILRLPEGASLRLGTSLTFRFDGDNGILLRVPQESRFSDVLQSPNNNIKADTRFYTSALSPALLIGVPPVSSSPIINFHDEVAGRNIVALLPHVGSASFSLAAALYPQILRTGEMSRLLKQTKEASDLKGASQVIERIESVASSPSPRIENQNGWLGWQLPYWDGKEIKNMQWLYKKSGNQDNLDNNLVSEHQALIDMHLHVLGHLQIQCFVSEGIWHFRIVTENKLPELIREELKLSLMFVASVMDITSVVNFLDGENNFYSILEQ